MLIQKKSSDGPVGDTLGTEYPIEALMMTLNPNRSLEMDFLLFLKTDLG